MKFEKLTYEKLKGYLELFTYIIFIATILGYFSKYNFIFDICSQFRMQYLLFAVVVLIYCIVKKKKDIISLLIILTIIFNLFPIIGSIKNNDITKKKGFTVEVINLLTKNDKYNAVREELSDNNPDIIVLSEIDDKWSEELQSIKEQYSYIYEISREDNFGMALYSKIHITKIQKLSIGTVDTPAISAFCDYQGKVFEIICVHTTPPINQQYFNNTKRIFKDLADYVKRNGHNVVIVGDFNTTMFSYNYKNFLKSSKMKDLSNIFNPTWPTFWFFPFRITLDHIFITKAFSVKDYSLSKKIGSDHFPIWAEISFKE